MATYAKPQYVRHSDAMGVTLCRTRLTSKNRTASEAIKLIAHTSEM